MNYGLIITPRNVLARLALGGMLNLGGLYLLAMPHQGPVPRILAAILLVVGGCVLAFGLRWFWRLFILAWFR
jgi:hypothetical protein